MPSRLPLAGLALTGSFGVPPADVLWSLFRGVGLGRRCPRPARGAARRGPLGHTRARRVAAADDDRCRPPPPDDHRRRPAAARTDGTQGTEDRRSLPVRPPSPANVAAVTRRRRRRRSPPPPPWSSPPVNPSSASLFVRTRSPRPVLSRARPRAARGGGRPMGHGAAASGGPGRRRVSRHRERQRKYKYDCN